MPIVFLSKGEYLGRLYDGRIGRHAGEYSGNGRAADRMLREGTIVKTERGDKRIEKIETGYYPTTKRRASAVISAYGAYTETKREHG